jgi:hypothetical protein
MQEARKLMQTKNHSQGVVAARVRVRRLAEPPVRPAIQGPLRPGFLCAPRPSVAVALSRSCAPPAVGGCAALAKPSRLQRPPPSVPSWERRNRGERRKRKEKTKRK